LREFIGLLNSHKVDYLIVGGTPSLCNAVDALRLPGLAEQLYETRLPDGLLFDAASRPEYGVRPALLRSQGLSAELGQRRVFVSGAFDLGTGFAVDGTTVGSRSTFLRLFPYRGSGLIDIGLLRLRAGADPDAVRAELAAALPKDVEVLTKAGFIAREQAYWRQNTPIGYVFTFGVVMGLVVGAVIVYLILFVNVAERLPKYATLKAIGFTDRALFSVVLQQAIILAVLGRPELRTSGSRLRSEVKYLQLRLLVRPAARTLVGDLLFVNKPLFPA
jgi:putative ABC transport system permease protein